MTKNKETKRSNKKKLGLILLLLLLIVITAIAPWQLPDRDPALTVQTPSVTLDPDTGEAIGGDYQGRTHEQILRDLESQQLMVTATLSSHAVFDSGRSGGLGSWMVENVKENDVIQQAEIYLGDRCIARSAAIRPGQHIQSIKLLEDIPAGTHDVTAYLNYFFVDTETFISKAGFNIKLTVHD